MDGKTKCRMLREIRARIAEENDIEFITRECTHQGKCRGTCPKCESELAYLEMELEKRRAAKKRVAVAGVSIGMALSMSSCDVDLDDLKELFPTQTPLGIEVLDGEIDRYRDEITGYLACPPQSTDEPEVMGDIYYEVPGE